MAEQTTQPSHSPTAVKDSTDSSSIDTKEKPRQIRRRNRIIASCLPCRQRKIRCDKLNPCSNCNKFSRSCLYIAPALDTVAQQELAELKDKLSNLEESLGRDVIRRAARSDASRSHNPDLAGAPGLDDDERDDDQQEPEDERDLESTPLAVFDQVYDDDADDELMDLGVAMGKMRITERIGGLVRPKLADELHANLNVGSNDEDTTPRRRPIFRQSYAFGSQPESSWQPNPMLPETYLAPGPDYIAPASNFFFPGVASTTPTNEFLPSRSVSDQLVAQYLLATHPVARVVHRPTFEKQYIMFWDNFNNGNSPPAPIQALIFAAMLSAAVSLSDNMAYQLTGMPKSMLVDRLRTTTEMSLSRAHFLQTTKIDTLQAFIMYMIPLCRNEISRAHSALVGAAIRLAQCMGLHRDGSLYGFSAADTHVRRLAWHQLCYLDIRTAETTGPRPQIRRDEFDTKLPLNVNDNDLLASPPPKEDSSSWTEMTLTKMKIELYDLIRQLWDDMQRMDRKKTTLTATLGKIQRFRASTGAKYMAMVQGRSPLQILTRQVYRAIINRCFVIILQRYAVSASHPMPDRLRSILNEAAICACDAGINIDTQPEMKSWAWYRPALLPYHAALLLLLDVYKRPDIPEAPRIWKVVDYVFELYPHLTPKEKAEGVLIELIDRLGVYQNMRKIKASMDIEGQAPHGITLSAMAKSLADTGTLNFANLQPMANNVATTNYSSPSESVGSRSGVQQESSAETAPHAMADIDWNEWETYFPQSQQSQSVLGNVDISADFDMGSFHPHNSYTMLPKPSLSM